MEAEYQPKGWLGPLCRSLYYHDFSDPNKFKSEYEKLCKQLKELLSDAHSQTTGLKSVASTA